MFSQIVQDGPNGPVSETILGEGNIPDTSKSNQVTVGFDFDQPFLRWLVNLFNRWNGPNYWVMDTDYDNYSLVVGCEE